MSHVDQATLRRRGTGLVAAEPARSAGGYTLFAPLTAGGAVYLVDAAGEVVHRWQMPLRAGRHAVILGNGNLGYNGNLADTPWHYPAWPMWHGGSFSEVTPEGDVVWQHIDPTHHHDAQWLDNGNVLYGAMEKLPDAFAQRLVGGEPSHAEGGGSYGDVVREVDRAGRLVWEWRAQDHLEPADYPTQAVFDRSHWPLVNGVWETKAGLVLMSLRTTSGVIGVDKASGDVRFRIGPEILAQQHTPVELDNGNVLVFDNGTMRPGLSAHYSRVIEVNPLTSAIEWSYTDPARGAFFSAYMGAAQRLWNGNTFITESATGRLFEVTPAGEVVWEYVVPFFGEFGDSAAARYSGGPQNSLFRAYRYRPEQIPWLKR